MQQLLLALVAIQDPTGVAPLPPGVIARVDGVEVTDSEFGRWLTAVHGWTYLDDYLAVVLLRQEAARAGLEVSAEDLEAALEDEWRHNVRLRYRGDEQAMRDSLVEIGLDQEGWLARKRFDMEQVVLARALVLARRQPTEKDLREIYERELPGGQRVHLEIAFFDRLSPLGPVRDVSPELLQRSTEAARRRAEEFLAAVRAAPERFAERVKATSDFLAVPRHDSFVDDLRDAGGSVPRYHASLFPLDPFQELLADPDVAAGQILGPVEQQTGFYVVRLVSREPVTFEEARAELDLHFRTRPPSPREILFLKEHLLERARVEKAPGFGVR